MDFEVRDPVRPGHVAVGAVERGGLGGAQVCAAVIELIPAQRSERAVPGDRRFKRRDPVGRRGRGEQMLQPILDPFDRTSRLARGEAHRDDVREDRLLDAEASAGIPRAAQPQPRARNPQRQRHHRMQRERTLEVGQDVVAVLPEVLGDHDEPLDRRTCVARITHRDRRPVLGACERGVGIAVAEVSIAHDVRADVAVQQRCAGRGPRRPDRPPGRARGTRPRSVRARLRPRSGRAPPPPPPALLRNAPDRPRARNAASAASRRR